MVSSSSSPEPEKPSVFALSDMLGGGLRRSPAGTTRRNCPWCGSVIPHDRFLEIAKKIRDEEAHKLLTERRRLGADFERRLNQKRGERISLRRRANAMYSPHSWATVMASIN